MGSSEIEVATKKAMILLISEEKISRFQMGARIIYQQMGERICIVVIF